MKHIVRLIFLIAFSSGLGWSCQKEDPNPNIPDVYINFTIDPNSTFYQQLNTAGGWMYLTADPPSRGIIVHRINNEEFVAFERMPPNDPNLCCENNNCTRLVVDEFYPFAKINAPAQPTRCSTEAFSKDRENMA